VIASHFAPQPGLRQPPVAHDRGRRHFQDARGFLDGQTSEKSHFDDAAFPLVEFGQRVQGFIQRDEVWGTLARDDELLVEGNSGGIAASLLIVPCAGVIDEDAPHHPRSHGEEMSPVVPCHRLRIDQSQIRLVDERCGLKTVIGALVADVALGDSMKLGVDERDQPLEGILVALRPLSQ